MYEKIILIILHGEWFLFLLAYILFPAASVNKATCLSPQSCYIDGPLHFWAS